MENKHVSRLLAFLLTALFLLAIPTQALAAGKFTPADTQARLDESFGIVIPTLKAYLEAEEEALADVETEVWFDVLSDFYAEASDGLDRFAGAAGIQNKDTAFKVEDGIYFSEYSFVAYKYGFLQWVDKRVYTKVSGAFNTPSGRFYVNNFIDTKTKDRLKDDYQHSDIFREFYNEYWVDTPKVCDAYKEYPEYLTHIIDVVPGTNYVYAQYAFLTGLDKYSREPLYDVYRIMANDKSVLMSKFVLTEEKLEANRIKSPYESWDAFRKTKQSLFEFKGNTLRIVVDGVEQELAAAPSAIAVDESESADE